MAYSRIFVTLAQGCSDYAKDVRGSAGRGILDIRNGRGRLLLQVQGLKPDRDYRVCLLGDKTCYEVPQRLGVNASGRGELKYELDDAQSLPEVKAMAVLVRDKAPLIGFVKENYNWQKCLMAENSDEKPQQAVIAVESISKDTENISDKDKENLKSIISGLEKAAIEAAAELNKNSDGDKDSSEGGYIAVHNAVKPFGEDNIVWTKASLREIGAIKPLWKYANNPFVISGCRQYKHILLGNDNGRYILGVPCDYEPSYKLEAQLQGFSGFRPVEGKELKKGEQCYCILEC